MAERLTDRPPLGLELLAGFAQRLPRLRELAAGIAHFLEPGFPVGDLQADDAPGHGDPALAVIRHGFRGFVEAALRLAELLGNVGHIRKTFPVELRPIVQRTDDIRTRSRLNRGGDPRLDIVGVDGLDGELHAQRLLALGRHLSLEQLVGGGHEVVPAQPVDARCLGIGRSAARGENARHPGRCGNCAAAGQFQEASPIETSHMSSPCGL